MKERPSEGMSLTELRDEYDWLYEFQSRMAERIRDDADVHNLVDYVSKLETENAKLRELADCAAKYISAGTCATCESRERCEANPLGCWILKDIRRLLGEVGIECGASWMDGTASWLNLIFGV